MAQEDASLSMTCICISYSICMVQYEDASMYLHEVFMGGRKDIS